MEEPGGVKAVGHGVMYGDSHGNQPFAALDEVFAHPDQREKQA